MKRKLYLLILCTSLLSNLIAGNIDLITARKVAEGFIKTRGSFALNTALAAASSDIAVNYNGKAAYYILNLHPQGYVIVPAVDAAPPVLAYSLESNFTLTDQPESLAKWMEGITKTIAYIAENNIEPSKSYRAQWDSYLNTSSSKNTSTITTVGPLIPCLWNQSAPYNYLCPADPTGSGGHVYSGCVATAMSQVMYYWRYPQHGTGSHGYTWNPYGYLFADFGNTTYNWDEMINGTTTQNFEMAQLQLQLGISVDMMYSGSGSGAYSSDAADALKTYFGYDQSLQLVNRDDYSYEDWKSLLRAQIDAGQPMYYNGYGTGGHAFNVDGYQDTMFFHFNWGWGGSYNGYFHLFNLNPGGNSFTNGQGAIINFIPAGNNVLPCGITDTLTRLIGTLEDGSGPVSPYFNNSSCSWLIMPDDTLESIKLSFDRFDIENEKDFLYIYDGTNTDASLIGSYTGNEIPPMVTATSGSMFIQFVTDGSGTTNGWFASFNAKPAPFCSSSITMITGTSGSLSDGSGSFNYRDKSICRYKLLPLNAMSISLTFNEFNTADDGDFLEIYDLETQNLLYKLSGQTNPGTLNFNTGKLYFIFVTDLQNSASGWDFTYTSSELTGLNSESAIKTSIFPNPAQKLIQVNLNEITAGYTLSLISATGNVVFKETSKSITANTISKIDVSAFPRGIYVLSVNTQKGSSYQKVVLN